MKVLALPIAMLLASFALAQNPTPIAQTSPPAPQRDNVVMLVPWDASSEGWMFLKSPDGTSGSFPISKIDEAFKVGYTPMTIGDLVDAAAADGKTIEDLQKRLSDITADYDRLVARYNRLAAINSTPPVQAQAQPAVDNSQIMKMMLLQSMFQRTPRPIQIDVRTTDCTKLPALCGVY